MLIYKHTFVEDEFHYLFKCDYFNEKRKTCIDKIYFKYYNVLIFSALMNLTKKIIKKNMHFY